MDTVVVALLWLHFMGLAAGMGGGFGMMLTGPRMAVATDAQRPVLAALMAGFDRITKGGLAALLVSGPLLLWLKYGGAAGLSAWFSAKMALVLAVVLLVAAREVVTRRARAGRPALAAWIPRIGRATSVAVMLAVLCAVLAFG